MKVYLKGIYQSIPFPVTGESWDGSKDDLSRIIKVYAVKDGKILPFEVKSSTGKALIFNHKVTHPDADNKHSFFLFNETKELVKSGNKLADLFN